MDIQDRISPTRTVTDFMNVVVKHIVDTANYCAYTVPLADLEKVISYKGNGNDSFMGIDSRKEIGKYHIEKPNDFIHIQKKAVDYLERQGFLVNGPITIFNKSLNAEIEINKKGIKETFGSGDRYQKLTRKTKDLKSAVLSELPNLLENSKLISSNNKNYHGNKSSAEYAYLETIATIDGVDYRIKFDIRQSEQKDKFWIHRIYDITEDNTAMISGVENGLSGFAQSDVAFAQNNSKHIGYCKSRRIFCYR